MAHRDIEKPAETKHQLMRQLEALTLTCRHLSNAALADKERAEAIGQCRQLITARMQESRGVADVADTWFESLPDAPTARILQRLFRENFAPHSADEVWTSMDERATELAQKADNKALRSKADAEQVEVFRSEIIGQLKQLESSRSKTGSTT